MSCTPVVRVIGGSQFFGVPDELMPPGDPGVNRSHCKNSLGQDEGTDAERLIECAGRTCYDSYGKGRTSVSYHQHIQDVDHGSVTEHATLSFFISGVSRGLTHELVRHRVGIAISQRSTRYVDESSSDWIMHPLLNKLIENEDDELGMCLKEDIDDLIKRSRELYDNVVNILEKRAITAGTDKLTARKQARGAARGLLGNALNTELVWTCNLRTLKTVLKQRASRHADAEIRVLANKLYEAAMPYWGQYLGNYQRSECPDGIGYELTLSV